MSILGKFLIKSKNKKSKRETDFVSYFLFKKILGKVSLFSLIAVFLIAVVIIGVSAYFVSRENRVLLAASLGWAFTSSSDYTVSDATKIEVSDGMAKLIAVDQTDDDNTSAGFGGGTETLVEWASDRLTLDAAGLVAGAGEFISRIIDTGGQSSWTSLGLTPDLPYSKDLPDDGNVESGYSEGGADMSSNVLLMHNDEDAGAFVQVLDSSGEENNGVPNGGVAPEAEGIFSTAYSFDGDDDYVEVDDDASLDISDDLTVEAWVNPTITIGDGLFVKNILAESGSFAGGSWADYDSDGDLDLFITAQGSTNQLHRNNGDGTFTQITGVGIAADNAYSTGSSWGDFDNDGDPDLYVTNNHTDNFFYVNNGDGTFDTIDGDGGPVPPIIDNGAASSGSSWVDYDNDGYLDLFVVNGYNNQRNYLFRYQGGEYNVGKFTKITVGNVVNDGGHSTGAIWADFDSDGDKDLYVTNGWTGGWDPDNKPNFFYLNDGDGTFTKVTTGDFVTDSYCSFGVSAADYDNDGDIDLYVANYYDQDNILYRNNGDATFVRITEGDLVNDGGWSFVPGWADYDNDGDLDLYVSNNGVNHFYTNNGDATFTKVTEGDIATDSDWTISPSWSDYDEDGDLDLFAYNNIGGSTVFYNNNGNGNNWINIDLIGTDGFVSAMSARVTATATIFGSSVTQVREVNMNGGWGGHNSFNVKLGLGDATKVDSLSIEWSDGTVDSFTDLSANQFLTVRGSSGGGEVQTTGTFIDQGIIEKDDAYVLGVYGNSAVAIVNDQRIVTTIEEGWNHLAMSYDNDAGSNQINLYLNGELASSGTLTEDININSNNLFIGQSFSGTIDEVAVHDAVLDAGEVLDHYMRGIMQLKYQVRSCDDASCSGESFIGPDGTSSTYYSEETNDTDSLPSFVLADINDNQYFQYKAYFETDSSSYSPKLAQASIGPVHYPGDKPSIRPGTSKGLSYNRLDGFSAEEGGGGSIGYQITNQGTKSSPAWYYWNGNNWVVASAANYNTVDEVNSNIDQFLADVGTGNFSFKALLISDTSQQPTIDDVAITYNNTAPYFETADYSFIGSDQSVAPPLVSFNTDVNDADGDNLTVYVYASADEDDLDDSLVCIDDNVDPAAEKTAQCDWDAPVVQPDDDTLFLSRFNFDSDRYGSITTDSELQYNTIYSQFSIDDETGNDHFATTSVARYGKWVSGQVGNGLVFDNHNDYVLIPDDTSINQDINSANALTMEAWVRPNNGGSCGMIVGNGGGWGQEGYHIIGIGDGKFRVEICNSTDGNGCMGALDTTAAIDNDTWSHLTVVYNGSTTKIYINGDEHVSKDWDGGVGVSAADVGLGKGLYSGWNCPTFKGDIDEVRIYSRDLSPAEVLQSYNRGVSNLASDVSSEGLELYLPFDETTGEAAADSSGNGNDGVLTNYTVPVYYDPEVKLGGAMHFDGIGGYFWWQLSAIPLVNTEEFSLAAWIKIDEDGLVDYQPIINDYHWYGDRVFQFARLSDGNLYFMISEDGVASHSETGDADTINLSEDNQINDSEWHYVVGTYKYLKDGMSKMRTYVDGELTSWTNKANGPVITVPDRHKHIGYIGNSSSYFKGYIDEPMIVDRELTADEIASNYRLVQGDYFWKAVVSDGVVSTETDVMDLTLNNPPAISLDEPIDWYQMTGSTIDLSASASDGDTDDIQTGIFISPTEEGLNSGQVCSSYDWSSSSLGCTIGDLPVPEDDDLVVHYKFDNDFYIEEEYALGGYDFDYDADPFGCYRIYNYAEGDYDLSDTTDETRSTGMQDCHPSWQNNRKWINGLVDEALWFDGGNDYVEVPDSDELDLTGEFTFDLWFYPYEPSGNPDQIFRKSHDVNKASYEFYYHTTSYFCTVDINNTEKCVSFSDDVFFKEEWNHLVAVHDGSEIKVYVNGELAATPVALASSEVAPSSTNLQIGNYPGGSSKDSRPFKGKIDEFHIYNRALDEEEILESFSDGLDSLASNHPPVDSTSDSLFDTQALYLSFDHQTGDIASDITGNGNNGTAKNYRYQEFDASDGRFAGSIDFLGPPEGTMYDQLIWVNGWNANTEWNEDGVGDLTDDMTFMAWVKPTGQTSSGYNVFYNRRFFKDPHRDHSDFFLSSYDDDDLLLTFRVHDQGTCDRSGPETAVGDFIAHCNGDPGGERCYLGEPNTCPEGQECLKDADEKDEWVGGDLANVIRGEDMDEWHHVAGTYHYNDETGFGEIYVYLDGQLAVQNLEATGPLCNLSGMPMQVGGYWPRYWDYSSNPFYGSMDDLAIYKRALTEEEIAGYYNNHFNQRQYYWKAAVSDGFDIAESEVRRFFFSENPQVDEVDVLPLTGALCTNSDIPELRATFSDADGDTTYGLFLLTRVADADGDTVEDETYLGTGSTTSEEDLTSYCSSVVPLGDPCIDYDFVPEEWQENFYEEGLPEGSYQLTVQAIDDYGATSDWSEVYEFDIDRTAPVINIDVDEFIEGAEAATATLSLDIRDVHEDGMEMKISDEVGEYDIAAEEPLLEWSDFATPITVNLLTGDEGKVFTVEVIDGCGNDNERNVGVGIVNPGVTVVSPKDERILGNDATYDDILFEWLFDDEDIGDTQSAYAIEIYSADEELLDETGWVEDSALSVAEEDLPLETGTEYQWRIKVRDSYELESDWSDLETFYTNARPAGLGIAFPEDESEHDYGFTKDPNTVFAQAVDPDAHSVEYQILLYEYHGGEAEEETMLDWSTEGLVLDALGQYKFDLSARKFTVGEYRIKVCSRDEYGLSGDCDESSIYITIGYLNRRPVAIANILSPIYEQPGIVYAGDEVVLDGTESYDLEHDPLTYDWITIEMPTGVSSEFDDYTSATPSILTRPGISGMYKFVLEVTDAGRRPAVSAFGTGCNSNNWVCFTAISEIGGQYCGDGLLQVDEDCDMFYDQLGETWLVAQGSSCELDLCNNCLCGERAIIPPPIWREVVPR